MMRMRFIHVALTALAALAAACTADERDSQPIHEPLKVCISQSGIHVTRSTTEGDGNTWAGGEQIALVVGNDVVSSTPTTTTDHVYTVSGTGTSQSLTALNLANTNYWTSRSETKKIVCAWSYGTTTAPTLTSHTLNTYTLPTTQSATSGELLYAPATVEKAYTASPNSFELQFYHQLTKVVFLVKLDAGSGAVSSPVMSIPGSGTQTAIDDDGSYDATWTFGSNTNITPYAETPTSAETADGVVARYSAIIIPGDYSSKALLKVTMGSTEYTYTGGAEVNNLQSGKRYTITVTVRNKLVFSGITVNAWSVGSSYNVVL